jgi:hypothetical protein
MGRITLETPTGRLIDLTPLSRRERVIRALGTATAYAVSALVWALAVSPIVLWLSGR